MARNNLYNTVRRPTDSPVMSLEAFEAARSISIPTPPGALPMDPSTGAIGNSHQEKANAGHENRERKIKVLMPRIT